MRLCWNLVENHWPVVRLPKAGSSARHYWNLISLSKTRHSRNSWALQRATQVRPTQFWTLKAKKANAKRWSWQRGGCFNMKSSFATYATYATKHRGTFLEFLEVSMTHSWSILQWIILIAYGLTVLHICRWWCLPSCFKIHVVHYLQTETTSTHSYCIFTQELRDAASCIEDGIIKPMKPKYCMCSLALIWMSMKSSRQAA